MSTTSATTRSSIDELQRAGAAAEAIAFSLQNDIVLPYLTDLTTPEQQQRWLPGVVTGETVLGIAMTEPGTGSDLAGIRTTAVRDGDHYVVNGAKTFISNGQSGDLFVIAVRTSPDRHKGLVASGGRRRTHRASVAAATWRRSACTPRTPASSPSPTCGCPSRICSEKRAGASIN